MTSINYLQNKPKSNENDLLLIKAYFGSTIYEYDTIK